MENPGGNRKIINRKIRLGFAGCGRVSVKHFEALQKHQNEIEVVAVCDPTEEKVNAVAQKMKAKAYNNLDDMLQCEKLDVVTIATMNSLHPEQVIKVASAGCHAITEKPMAIKLADGIKMTQFCNQKNVKLFVIHQNRFNNTAQQVWKARQENRFGKIYLMVANLFWNRQQSYYDKDATWHGSKNLDGGAFFTQASHYVDFMGWIAESKPKIVYANLKTLERNIETEDTGIANIEWENKIIGSLNVTMLTYPQDLEGSVTIIGEKGTVKIGGVAMNEIQHWNFSEQKIEDQNIMNNNYKTNSVYGFGHVLYYQNVIDVLKKNAKPLIDGEEGLKSLTILEAIYSSSKEKKPVCVKNLSSNV